MKLIVTRRIMALAALLVSMFMAACRPHSTNPSTETLTVYEDAPALKPLDLGSPGKVRATCIIFLLRCILALAVL